LLSPLATGKAYRVPTQAAGEPERVPRAGIASTSSCFFVIEMMRVAVAGSSQDVIYLVLLQQSWIEAKYR
jgi:hypothetical protein